MLQGGILFVAIVFVLVNLIVDISYAIINPRIRLLVSVAELEAADVALEVAASGLWRDAWLRLRRNPGAIVGFALVAAVRRRRDLRAADRAVRSARPGPTLIAKGAAPGPRRTTGSASTSSGATSSRGSSTARASRSLIGVVAVAVGLSIGLVLGSIAGYVGGFVDSVVMRLMDIMLAIPGLLLAIGIVAMLGPGLWQIMVAVGVTNVPIFARLLRGSILAQRENDFVLAARPSACRDARSSPRTSSRTRSRR